MIRVLTAAMTAILPLAACGPQQTAADIATPVDPAPTDGAAAAVPAEAAVEGVSGTTAEAPPAPN